MAVLVWKNSAQIQWKHSEMLFVGRKAVAAVVAVSSIVPGGIPQAAMDGAGMKYVSGKEGLGGSIRLNLPKVKTDFVGTDGSRLGDDV